MCSPKVTCDFNSSSSPLLRFQLFQLGIRAIPFTQLLILIIVDYSELHHQGNKSKESGASRQLDSTGGDRFWK